MQSLKLITQKTLPKCPVGGNVAYDDIWDEIDNLMVTNNNNFKNEIEITMDEMNEYQNQGGAHGSPGQGMGGQQKDQLNVVDLEAEGGIGIGIEQEAPQQTRNPATVTRTEEEFILQGVNHPKLNLAFDKVVSAGPKLAAKVPWQKQRQQNKSISSQRNLLVSAEELQTLDDF